MFEDKREDRALELIASELKEIAFWLKKLAGGQAVSATLTISDSKGNKLMSATLPVGNTATAVFQEWSGPNGTGAKLASAGAVSFVSSDPTIATVDSASGLVTAVAVGTATITGTDAANGLTASDSVSDTPLVAQSATLVITPN
jgi:uncharacterized protein YjdB